MMKKYKLPLFILIFLSIIVALSQIPVSEDYYIYNMRYKNIKIHEEEENSIDVLFAGDSIAYSSFSPMELYQNYGYTSYVVASAGQYIYETDILLDTVLKKQSPKVLVLETDILFRKYDSDSFISSRLGKYFPILVNHDLWKQKLFNKQENEFDYPNYLKGFRYNKKVKKKHHYKEHKTNSFPIYSQGIIDSIVERCKEEGIELVFVSCPNLKSYNAKKHDYLVEYTTKNNIPYLDLNLEGMDKKINWNKDSRDGGDHLNYRGAVKVSQAIGQYLSRYNLPNHLPEKIWQDDLNQYIQYKRTH